MTHLHEIVGQAGKTAAQHSGSNLFGSFIGLHFYSPLFSLPAKFHNCITIYCYMFMKIVPTCTHKVSLTLYVHRIEKKEEEKNTTDPVHYGWSTGLFTLMSLEKGYCEMDLVFVCLVVPISKSQNDLGKGWWG